MRRSALLIDYGAGNIASAQRAFTLAGWEVHLANQPDQAKACDLVIIPGVGHFGQCVTHLADSGFVPFIEARIQAGNPLLGICVGLQVLYQRSQEAPDIPGIGLLAGQVVRIPDDGIRAVPHMGWNSLTVDTPTPVTEGLDGQHMYFVHSYMVVPEAEHTLAHADHDGVTIPAIVQEGPVLATQFHPEKSGLAGRHLLTNLKELSWA